MERAHNAVKKLYMISYGENATHWENQLQGIQGVSDRLTEEVCSVLRSYGAQWGEFIVSKNRVQGISVSVERELEVASFLASKSIASEEPISLTNPVTNEVRRLFILKN